MPFRRIGPEQRIETDPLHVAVRVDDGAEAWAFEREAGDLEPTNAAAIVVEKLGL